MASWSPQQEQALAAVSDWFKNGSSPLFKLFGFAGTGKTTLAKHFAEHVTGEVLFGAYTGKAASVLRSKGCDNASTIHQLIYRPSSKSKRKLRELEAKLDDLAREKGFADRDEAMKDEKFSKRVTAQKLAAAINDELTYLRQPQFNLNEAALTSATSLLIIDECSMVDKRMAEDLLSFDVPILVLGDPAQLPPVGGGGAFTSGKGDFMLTEIHRQAEGDPIIQLATQIRSGERISLGEYGKSSVINRRDVTKEIAQAHDQIIVGRNATRHKLNKLMRIWRDLDVAQGPTPGEKLVCLRNDHDLGLLNGTLWEVNASKLVGVDEWDSDSRLIMDLSEICEANPLNLTNVVAFSDTFYGHEDQRSWHERREAQEFDYGYALTCHKAQGSQWGSVLVRDESGCFRANAKEWLYTAVTRACDRVTIAVD